MDPDPITTALEDREGALVVPEPSAVDELRRLLAAFLVGYEGHTRAAYARDLADWLAFCHHRSIDPLTAHRAHVDAYARELGELQGRARSTVARRLSALAGFYAYALDEGLIQRSPLAGVRRPKLAEDSQTTGLDRDQLRALLAVARERAVTGAGQSVRDLALVTLLAFNGLNASINASMRPVRRGSLVSSLPRPVAGGLSGDVRPRRAVWPGSVRGLIGACLVPD